MVEHWPSKPGMTSSTLAARSESVRRGRYRSTLKVAEQQQARHLRSQGWSLKEICDCLDVSKSSVSLWVRDVELGPAERERLIKRVRQGPIVAGERKATRAREVRRSYQEEGR